MLGFNFYRPSPRFIEPPEARKIIEAVKDEFELTAVGVFVNSTIEDVLSIVEAAALDGVQLHGDETPKYCSELKPRLNGRRVIKAMRVDDSFQAADAVAYPVDAIMLDAFDRSLRGGTGRTVDWTVAREVSRRVSRFFLSGGLSPENVGAAITAVQPFAVDACSLLESSPGKKDGARVQAFVRAVREVTVSESNRAFQNLS